MQPVAKKSKGGLPQISFRWYWNAIIGKLDKGEDGKALMKVTPHILRHTYITALCSSGLDIKKIQYLAGHADPAMTLKVYACVK